MEMHVRLVGVLHVVLGLIGIAAAVCFLFVCGGAGGIAQPFLGVLGGTLGTVVLVLALPGTIGGIGVLLFREWGRVLMIVVSVLDLFNIPLGTILGVYGLWVLLHRQTMPLFQPPEPSRSSLAA
jgi:hypothetical protein